ncbi:MAG: hypothetical protein ACJAVI_005831 [Candidatus Azotimanducaceae bacterium]
MASWASARRETGASEQTVQVLSGDWGAVTLKLTQAYGKCFAVLNMANAYVEGTIAQEDARRNMIKLQTGIYQK